MSKTTDSVKGKSEIVKEFNEITKNLINQLKRKTRSELDLANIERLEKRLSLLRNTAGSQALIEEAGPYILDYSEKIINRDEDFFMKMDVRSKFSGKVSAEDKFIFTLIDSIRVHYNKARQAERDEVYNAVKSLHDNYVEYLLACQGN